MFRFALALIYQANNALIIKMTASSTATTFTMYNVNNFPNFCSPTESKLVTLSQMHLEVVLARPLKQVGAAAKSVRSEVI